MTTDGSTALVLAAHGSRHEPAVNELLRDGARKLSQLGEFSEVAAAFHQGTPTFSEVLDGLSARRVVVVPVMTSEGYYCDEFLPAELARNRRCREVELTITRPVGVHAKIIDLAEMRAVELAARFCVNPQAVSLAVVGHGTPRNPKSREATERLVHELQRRGRFAEVQAFFLDEAPLVEDIRDRCSSTTILVLPFLISGGPHAARDIPKRLGLDTTPGDIPPYRARVGGRDLICDTALGADLRLLDVILVLARDGRDARTTHQKRVLRLGTRGSKLALWQANHVAGLLQGEGIDVEIVTLSTAGDRLADVPIRDLPGDDAFTGDITAALAQGCIDLAVHALKDLPVVQGLDEAADRNLKIAAVLPRGPVGESLVSFNNISLFHLPPGAVVGTSSPRRAAQLLAARADLVVRPIRGAVDDRVRQVQSHKFDAAVLATAGLQRLGLLDAACESLPLDLFLPAPGQGALVIHTRADDSETLHLCERLDDPATRLAATAELEFLRPFEFSDSHIAAAYSRTVAASEHQSPRNIPGAFPANGLSCSKIVELRARLLSPDGARVVDVTLSGHDPRELARRAVEQALVRFDATMEVRT